jgi:hypothetical protein
VVRRDEALHALRRKVTGREFEFATGLEVTDGGPAGFCCACGLGSGSTRTP